MPSYLRVQRLAQHLQQRLLNWFRLSRVVENLSRFVFFLSLYVPLLKRYLSVFLLNLSIVLVVFPAVAGEQQFNTQTVVFDGLSFRALLVNPKHVSLHWRQANGDAFGNFITLKGALRADKKRVLALMNAGIYGKNDEPAGLHVENGQLLHPLNTKKGHGNFHIQPNGVFLITQKGEAKIITTKMYQKHYAGQENTLTLATQSGPLLVINGKRNRRLLPKSQSTYTRNGVCTTVDGRLLFLSTGGVPSNFYQFARASQQVGCDNTLYLDGNISKLYVAGENSTFHLSHFVGILSVTDSI